MEKSVDLRGVEERKDRQHIPWRMVRGYRFLGDATFTVQLEHHIECDAIFEAHLELLTGTLVCKALPDVGKELPPPLISQEVASPILGKRKKKVELPPNLLRPEVDTPPSPSPSPSSPGPRFPSVEVVDAETLWLDGLLYKKRQLREGSLSANERYLGKAKWAEVDHVYVPLSMHLVELRRTPFVVVERTPCLFRGRFLEAPPGITEEIFTVQLSHVEAAGKVRVFLERNALDERHAELSVCDHAHMTLVTSSNCPSAWKPLEELAAGAPFPMVSLKAAVFTAENSGVLDASRLTVERAVVRVYDRAEVKLDLAESRLHREFYSPYANITCRPGLYCVTTQKRDHAT
jgi:hypothetical protein